MAAGKMDNEIRTRLAKLAEMMQSTFEAERATAARMCIELLDRHGLKWTDIIMAAPASGYAGHSASENPRQSSNSARARMDIADRLIQCDGIWSEWEESFLHTMSDWSGTLSDKQELSWDRIIEKAKRREVL